MTVSLHHFVSGNFTVLLDDAGGGVTYTGKTYPGGATDAPVWQIRRITSLDGDVAVQFAEGNDLFDKVWDARASLNYV